jgi:hypothetical protein
MPVRASVADMSRCEPLRKVMERIAGFRVVSCAGIPWGNSVIGRQYFVRQATTLLKFAKSTSDPKVAAAVMEKAAELKSQGDRALPPADLTPLAPDIEPPPT